MIRSQNYGAGRNAEESTSPLHFPPQAHWATCSAFSLWLATTLPAAWRPLSLPRCPTLILCLYHTWLLSQHLAVRKVHVQWYSGTVAVFGHIGTGRSTGRRRKAALSGLQCAPSFLSSLLHLTQVTAATRTGDLHLPVSYSSTQMAWVFFSSSSAASWDCLALVISVHLATGRTSRL